VAPGVATAVALPVPATGIGAFNVALVLTVVVDGAAATAAAGATVSEWTDAGDAAWESAPLCGAAAEPTALPRNVAVTASVSRRW